MLKLKYVFIVIILIMTSLGICTIKYYVKELERETTNLNQQIASEKETIATLKAEWAYLNQPERLHQLVNKYLDLSPLNLQQIHMAKATNSVDKAAPQRPVIVSNRTKVANSLLSNVSFERKSTIDKIKWDEKRNKFVKIRNKGGSN